MRGWYNYVNALSNTRINWYRAAKLQNLNGRCHHSLSEHVIGLFLPWKHCCVHKERWTCSSLIWWFKLVTAFQQLKNNNHHRALEPPRAVTKMSGRTRWSLMGDITWKLPPVSASGPTYPSLDVKPLLVCTHVYAPGRHHVTNYKQLNSSVTSFKVQPVFRRP